jgi:hypothetical protein
MNQPGHAGFAYDYALLRATPGCDLDELKRCYRLAVRDLHPDRNPELAADSAAQDALSELTIAYRRLHDYHRAYGRLPGETLRRAANPPDPNRPVAAARPPAGGRRRWIGFALAAGAAFYWLWPREAVEPAAAPAAVAPPPPASTSPPSVRGFSDPYADAESAVRKAVRIGDTKLKVRAILGTPILGTAEVWEYGPSHVRFEDGRVIDWYSSPLTPIAVDESSRQRGTHGESRAE